MSAKLGAKEANLAVIIATALDVTSLQQGHAFVEVSS